MPHYSLMIAGHFHRAQPAQIYRPDCDCCVGERIAWTRCARCLECPKEQQLPTWRFTFSHQKRSSLFSRHVLHAEYGAISPEIWRKREKRHPFQTGGDLCFIPINQCAKHWPDSVYIRLEAGGYIVPIDKIIEEICEIIRPFVAEINIV